MSGSGYQKLPPADGTVGSSVGAPITGNLYMWLARGDQELTITSRKKKGLAILIVIMQIIGPPAIAYYQCSIFDWTSSTWELHANLFSKLPLDQTAPGNVLPLWPNAVAKKIMTSIMYFMFVHNRVAHLELKAYSLAKMKLGDHIVSQGDQFWMILAGPIMALAYVCTCFATFIVLLVQPNVMDALMNATGLLILSDLDEVGGVDFTPLTEDDWDPAAEGQKFYDKVKKEYPDVDPNNRVQMKPYVEKFSTCWLSNAWVLLTIMSIVLAPLVFFIDQSGIAQVDGILI